MGLSDKTSKMTAKKVSCSSGLKPTVTILMLLMSSLVHINRASFAYLINDTVWTNSRFTNHSKHWMIILWSLSPGPHTYSILCPCQRWSQQGKYSMGRDQESTLLCVLPMTKESSGLIKCNFINSPIIFSLCLNVDNNQSAVFFLWFLPLWLS